MEVNNYIEYILEKLQYHYDVEKLKTENGIEFDLYAKSDVLNSKYMGSKKIVIYEYENNSHIYLKSFSSVDVDQMKSVLDANVDFLLNQTTVDETHMSTHYTFVFVSEEILSDDSKKFVRKYKKQKSFAFGFKGWSSINVILISLDNKEIVYNKDAKKIHKSFKAQ